MSKENSIYDLKITKTIALPVPRVFKALSEGRLFFNCSADHKLFKIDFRVGGHYALEFINYGMKNCGQFLEIVPNQKIVFTWCQDYASNPVGDTKVTIDLREIAGGTELTLVHAGFADKENMEAHTGGWTGGLEDLAQEMLNGKLRLARQYAMPVEKLFERCTASGSFFGHKGEFLELVANQKAVFAYPKISTGEAIPGGSKVTLLFEADDDATQAWVELLHEGLMQDAHQKQVRAYWDESLKQLKA